MKTDTEIKKEVRAERHKVFWRLHSLPWILLVLFLIGFNFYRIYESNHDVKDFQTAKEESFQEGLLQGKREVRSEALSKGYGEFQVSPDYEIIFKWFELTKSKLSKEETELSKEETEILPKEQTTPRRQQEDQEDYVSGVLEYRTSKELGIDLEKELLEGVDQKVNGIIKTIDIDMTEVERTRLIRILSMNLESSIRTKFEGLRAYHRLK